MWWNIIIILVTSPRKPFIIYASELKENHEEMFPRCDDYAITMQSLCNHYAITMQSLCNHYQMTIKLCNKIPTSRKGFIINWWRLLNFRRRVSYQFGVHHRSYPKTLIVIPKRTLQNYKKCFHVRYGSKWVMNVWL